MSELFSTFDVLKMIATALSLSLTVLPAISACLSSDDRLDERMVDNYANFNIFIPNK